MSTPLGDPVLKGPGWAVLRCCLARGGSAGRSPGQSLEPLLPADPCLFCQVGPSVSISISFHAAVLLSLSFFFFPALLCFTFCLALHFHFFPFKNITRWGFPGGAVVKNLPANAGNTGSSPGPGRSPMPWSS